MANLFKVYYTHRIFGGTENKCGVVDAKDEITAKQIFIDYTIKMNMHNVKIINVEKA